MDSGREETQNEEVLMDPDQPVSNDETTINEEDIEMRTMEAPVEEDAADTAEGEQVFTTQAVETAPPAEAEEVSNVAFIAGAVVVVLLLVAIGVMWNKRRNN